MCVKMVEIWRDFAVQWFYQFHFRLMFCVGIVFVFNRINQTDIFSLASAQFTHNHQKTLFATTLP